MDKIKKLNQENSELKSQIKKIEFRDISKIIINNYISKYENKLSHSNNKKDKVYKISKFLKGKEQVYFIKLIDDYYHSNELSHITGLLEDYKKKYIVGLSNINLKQKIISDYILNIFGVEKDENYNNKKSYIMEVFELNEIISLVFKNLNNF